MYRTLTVQGTTAGTVAQFKPSMGTLRSVKVHLETTFVVKLGITGAKGTPVTYMLSSPVTYITAPSVPAPPLKALLSASGAFKPGTSSTQFVAKAITEPSRTDAAALAAFRGTGSVTIIGKWNANQPDTMTLDQGAKLASYAMDYSSLPTYWVTYTYLPALPKLPAK